MRVEKDVGQVCITRSSMKAARSNSRDKPARLIIRCLFGFSSDYVFVKLNQNINKYWDSNALY